MRKLLLLIIDFFYPLFARWFSVRTYRYLASGCITAGTAILGYFIIYNYLLNQQSIRVYGLLITAHTLALFLNSLLTFSVGFILNKYLVFTASTLKGRIQLFRYGTVFVGNILMNLALLKILVEGLGVFPSIANGLITILLALISYFLQKHFSFRDKR